MPAITLIRRTEVRTSVLFLTGNLRSWNTKKCKDSDCFFRCRTPETAERGLKSDNEKKKDPDCGFASVVRVFFCRIPLPVVSGFNPRSVFTGVRHINVPSIIGTTRLLFSGADCPLVGGGYRFAPPATAASLFLCFPPAAFAFQLRGGGFSPLLVE